MKVTFEYTKTDDSRMLSMKFDGEYSEKDKEEALMAIIDTILPTNGFDTLENNLLKAWLDYKWDKKLRNNEL